jgi:hypothetical protein
MEKEMKIQQYKSYYLFLILLVSFMFVYGCGEKGKSSIQPKTVEREHLMEMDSKYPKEINVVKDAPSGSESLQAVPINDQIQMEQWKQLLKDVKSTLGDIKEVTEQAR